MPGLLALALAVGSGGSPVGVVGVVGMHGVVARLRRMKLSVQEALMSVNYLGRRYGMSRR